MAQRGSIAPQGRRIYLKGIGLQHRLKSGAFAWKSPQPKRHKKQTDRQRYATGTMAAMAWFQKLATPWELQSAKDVAKGSGFTWKDQLLAQFCGTDAECMTKDGILWKGRRVLAKEVQPLLDSISSTPGSILVRTDAGWAALYPGIAGEVLTMNGTSFIPNWETLDPGYTSFTPSLSWTTQPSGLSYASRYGLAVYRPPQLDLFINIALSTKGSGGGGYMTITDLPTFTSAPDISFAGSVVTDRFSLATGYTQLNCMYDTTNGLAIWESGSAEYKKQILWAGTYNDASIALHVPLLVTSFG